MKEVLKDVVRKRESMMLIIYMDLEDKILKKSSGIGIIDTYRDDDTFSEERVEETLESIKRGSCEIWL